MCPLYLVTAFCFSICQPVSGNTNGILFDGGNSAFTN